MAIFLIGGDTGGGRDEDGSAIASGSDGGVRVDVLTIEDPSSPTSGLLPEAGRRCVRVQVAVTNDSEAEVFIDGGNFALFDADERGVGGEDLPPPVCSPEEGFVFGELIPSGGRAVGWVGFQPEEDFVYSELAFGTASGAVIRIALPARDTDGLARGTGEPGSLPASETCALPSSFDFTSEWTLGTSNMRALLQEAANGETLAAILGSALDGAELRGSAAGSFSAPSQVTMEVRLGEVELDIRVLPDFMEVVIPASQEVYEGKATGNDVMFSQEVCGDLVRGLIDMGVPAKQETVDNVPAYHVHVDEQELQQLAALLDRQGVLDDWGVFYVGDTEISVLEGMAPAQLSADLWFAQDGLWPARIEADGTWDVEGVGRVGLSLTYEVTGVPSVTGPSSLPAGPETPSSQRQDDSEAVRALVVDETDLLNRGDAEGIYALFSSALQDACPYSQFLNNFSMTRSSLGARRAEVRNVSVEVTGGAAYASYDIYVDGAFSTRRTGDRFVKQNGRWYDDLDSDDC